MSAEIPILIQESKEVQFRTFIISLITDSSVYSRLLEKVESINTSPLAKELGVRVYKVFGSVEKNTAGYAEIEVALSIRFAERFLDTKLDTFFGELADDVGYLHKGTYLFTQTGSFLPKKPTQEELKNDGCIGFTVGFRVPFHSYRNILLQIPQWNSPKVLSKYPGVTHVQFVRSTLGKDQKASEVQLAFWGKFPSGLLYYFIQNEIGEDMGIHTHFYPILRAQKQNHSEDASESPDTVQPDQPSL